VVHPGPPITPPMHLRDALKAVRHGGRWALSLVLARLIGTRRYATTLQPQAVSSVLICRLNGRIGNTMFLTPLIRQLHELLPHAAIDLAVGYPRAAELLGSLPGVRRVITFPHRAPHKIWRYVAALRSMRAERYSLAIDPIPESSSGHTLLSLARAQYRLGFASPNQWAPVTHAVPVPPQIVHRALQPVFLVSQIFGSVYPPSDLRLWLPLPQNELAAGRRLIAEAIGPAASTSANPVFGFFAHATHLKVVGEDWWRDFWAAFLELEPQAVPLEFLPSRDCAPINAHFASVHIPSTRALTAAIAATRMFISPDAGPMHLASSTDVPTIGLFHVTDPAYFGPLKAIDHAIDIRQYSALQTAQYCQRLWRAAGNQQPID
jgi:heptosyltransferase III